ncbi:hypothetical protein [Pararhodobacter sp. CCB-MM2]|uniref:hypothetical protein n=1 Tax=Pararhodobacter sp. CCB-MM2 TaxID=1786003 RepID=UPI000829ED9B|nr:hypothetical protein [Pararhodobacter sp. CCB-MM2]
MSLYQNFKQGFLIAAAGAAFSTAMAGAAAAQQCPDWQLGGIPITTDAETAWVPQQYPLFAGGGLDLNACGTVQGVGRVTPAPNFTIQYDAMTFGRDLEFRVETECDTTLLINDSTGQWHFNDDANGTLQPAMRLPAAASGQYDVWVGTFGSQSCQATLVVESFPPAGGSTGGGTPAAPTCPEWSLGGAEVRLNGGGTETRQVVAGGSVNLFDDQCGMQAHGYVAQAPDFSLYYDPAGSTAPLNISVQGQCDTLLLVNDPTTAWLFNDDATDLQPALEIADAQAGRYDIWVGTFGANTCQSSITISAAPQAPAAPSNGK